MLRLIKSIWFVLVLAGLLVGCAAPAPTSAPVPTTQPEPTQPTPAATSVPSIPSEQVTIPVGEGNETLNATLTGNGEIAVVMANTGGNDPLSWSPLVDALSKNKNLKIVTFAYRTDNQDTHFADTVAVFEYLKNQGVNKVICVGAHPGAYACYGLRDEPEIAGMVLIASQTPAIEANFPKLFLTADADPFGLAGPTQRAYEQSAEPKAFKSYAAGVHGPALFFKPDVGPQVLADITDFINGIVSGQ